MQGLGALLIYMSFIAPLFFIPFFVQRYKGNVVISLLRSVVFTAIISVLMFYVGMSLALSDGLGS